MKKGRVSIPLTGLTPPHYCVSTKQGLGFSTPYVTIVAFLCVQLFQLILNGIDKIYSNSQGLNKT